MNDLEREKFWNTLCELDGTNPIEEAKKLQETITLPKKLYRYRPVSIKTLEALQNNKLYFSTANYYDDPFDTFINVRINDIRPKLIELQNADNADIIKLIEVLLKEIKGVNIDYDNALMMVNQLKGTLSNPQCADALEIYFRNIRNEIKKDTLSVCFSESPFNESLWLKYANQHKGFSVEYDLYDDTKRLCGKQDKCKKCGINTIEMSLYPMYYSDDMYDATNFAQFLVACKQFGSDLTEEMLGKLQILFGNQAWEREKITLIKKTCHKYDEEWRMIIHGSLLGPVVNEWIPSAIYLGLNMDSNEMNLISEIAKNAGVEKIYKCVITDAGKLDAVLIN